MAVTAGGHGKAGFLIFLKFFSSLAKNCYSYYEDKKRINSIIKTAAKQKKRLQLNEHEANQTCILSTNRSSPQQGNALERWAAHA